VVGLGLAILVPLSFAAIAGPGRCRPIHEK
jgi:hypothetical protein